MSSSQILLNKKSLSQSLSQFDDKGPNAPSYSFTRSLKSIPVPVHNVMRDTGGARWLSDTLLEAALPFVALRNPIFIPKFITETIHHNKISYGTNSQQYIELYKPSINNENRTKLVYFIHGGAWGSGKPWYYRLVSRAFTSQGFTVAICGFRTWPDASLSKQIDDVLQGASKLAQIGFKNFQTFLVGHSSGAHVALWCLIRQKITKVDTPYPSPILNFSHFVGLSGVYKVSDHFLYEKNRGVEELSPMGGACGKTFSNLLEASIPEYLANFVGERPGISEAEVFKQINECKLLFLSGVEDVVVPFVNTAKTCRQLRSFGMSNITELYFPCCQHETPVMELMTGGRVADAVLDFLQNDVAKPTISSKL